MTTIPVDSPAAASANVKARKAALFWTLQLGLLIALVFAILFAVPLLGEPLDATTLIFAVAVVATVILGRRLSRT